MINVKYAEKSKIIFVPIIYVCTVYIYYVYINAHIQYIFKCIHLCPIIYIIYKYI